jgi:hypothetical protein
MQSSAIQTRIQRYACLSLGLFSHIPSSEQCTMSFMREQWATIYGQVRFGGG